MTSTSNSTTTAGRARASGSGLVLAGDRSASRKKAGRHSSTVKILKMSLPISAVAVIALYSVSVLKVTGWGAGIPELQMPKIIADNIAMENPHYEGFNKDGGQYWVTAKSAKPDLKNLANFTLDAITGDLVDAQKSKTHLTATRGTFNNKTNVLELFESIDIDGDNGLKSHLTRATVHTKENVITSDEPVVVMMEAGTVNANQMTVRQKTKEYTFIDKVRTYLKGKEPATADAARSAPKSATSFGNSSEPIDIVSQRLDVDDLKKSAVFTGGVKAVQGTTSLSSPEMTVNYDGSAVPASAAKDASAQGGGKVKRVTATNPVVLTQADGQTVTSRTADFDAVNQKAVLEGDVVMAQLPDKRAAGDRAEFDETANTMLLTGNVVVTQGNNIMKGRRLLYNRAANKMQLSAPGAGAGARVITHFQQDGSAGASKSEPAKADAVQGIAFGGSFKTDPKAPVDVESDRLDIDDAKKEAVFLGAVHAVQGDFVIRSAELVASYAGSAGLGAETAADQQKTEAAHLTRLQAKKNVVVTSKDGQSATGDWADFDTRANTVTLGGNVVMTQNKNVVRGTKLVIDMTTGESIIRTEPTTTGGTPAVSQSDGTATSGIVTSSGRPSAVFYPNEIKGGAGGAAAAKAVKKAVPNGWSTESARTKPR